MPQFDLYRNTSATAEEAPYLLDLQSDAVDVLETRLVAPLRPRKSIAWLIRAIHPEVRMGSRAFIVSMGELSAVSRGELGPVVANLSPQRGEFVAALDLLFTGI
jgi:toxin CcdB